MTTPNTDKSYYQIGEGKRIPIKDEKALKYDLTKPRMELLSPVALEKVAEVLTFGAQKYSAHNWRNGFEWGRLYGAALRHLTAHMGGEDIDPESGLSHLAHAGCCLMFLLEHEARGLGTDDRYKGKEELTKDQIPDIVKEKLK